jgi:uncharacterized protein (UPF0332 family)
MKTSLEELLRDRIIKRTKTNPALVIGVLKHAQRDIDTARTLIENRRFDWSLAVSYNAMLLAGRALMFSKGYRPSTRDGHTAVVRFLRASLRAEIGDKVIMMFDGMRKKRHKIMYEEMDIVSGDEARRALEWAKEFVDKIDEIIRKK